MPTIVPGPWFQRLTGALRLGEDNFRETHFSQCAWTFSNIQRTQSRYEYRRNRQTYAMDYRADTRG